MTSTKKYRIRLTTDEQKELKALYPAGEPPRTSRLTRASC